ncbi:outer membrane beta-barrel protein [Thaumasiovibrio subtropicus]|uniref:outer membrane beta-barrel protein n=2 Tax=Thaumasiovibrio subtropicus TaxID=1891207 RepID=UPI001C8533DF|nr:outer membrane beta-barrel protein [Thaumasiovibrio subtropicus]
MTLFSAVNAAEHSHEHQHEYQPEYKHRIGLGKSSSEIDGHDYGDGFKFTYGYDFNQIFGFFVSAEKNDDISVSDSTGSWESDGTTWKLGTDIGYTFEFDKLSVKPYGAVGFFSYDETGEICLHSRYGYGCIPTEYDDSGVYYGLGLRLNYDRVYIEVQKDFLEVENYDLDQLSFSLGYRF